jgi:hypothetical protein
MSLFGEICSRWRCGAESRTYQPDHWFTKSRRTAVLPCGASERGSNASGRQSAPGSNPRRERTEVSRGHISRRGLGDRAVKGRT